MSRPTLIILIVAAGCAGNADDFALGHVEARLDTNGDLALGRTYVGDLIERDIEVRSTGTGIGRIEGITASGADLTVVFDEDAARGIVPGSVLRVSVTWRPTLPGALPQDAGVTVRGEGQSFWIPASGDALAIPDCDDGNPCTDDSFDRTLARCINAALDAMPCDDGNACTEQDHCIAGSCMGTVTACDDGNPCTLNLCDPISGCTTTPNPSYCEDGDPCTVGTCNATGGCDFSPAPDGTQCGDFDCATTHVCFGGLCETIDVSGATDGIPCDDGEACTGDDRCAGGLCIPGTPELGAPQIVASFETFGGTGSWVATDGYRYLFADRDALRLAVESTLGVIGAGLGQRARIDLIAATAPVAWAPGHFVVATSDALHMIDATNIDAPVIAWSEPSLIGPYSQVARADGGLVIHAQYVSSGGPHFQPLVDVTDAPDPGDNSDEPMVPPTTVPFRPFGPPIRLGETVVFDLDADGPYVTWSDGNSIHFVVIGPTGEILERQHYVGDPDADGAMFSKVSIRGRRVAALAGDRIELLDFEPPPLSTCIDDPPAASCQPFTPAYRTPTIPVPGEYLPCGGVVETNCMIGTSCNYVWVACAGDGTGCVQQVGLCMPVVPNVPINPSDGLQAMPGTRDLLIGDTFVYFATDEGIFMSPPYLVQMVPTLVDPMPATRIDRDLNGQHLLLHGGIALPLRANNGWMMTIIDLSSFTRVTGQLHGELVAMVPDGDEVILAGPVAIARFDTTNLTFTEWNLTESSATGEHARAIKSSEGAALVQTHNDNYATYGWPGECVGPELDLHDASSPQANVTIAATSQVLCGMFSGSFDIAGEWVWAYTSDRPDVMGSMPLGRIRAWQLGGGPEALIDLPANETYDYWAPTTVRVSDDGTSVAMLSVPMTDIEPWGIEARIYRADPSEVASAFTTYLPGGWWSYGQPLRDTIAFEGDLFLYGRTGEVALHTSLLFADPIWISPLALTLEEADPSAPPRVPYMRDGRAWVAWEQLGPILVNSGTLIFHRLTQVSYGLGQLDDKGGVTLEQPAIRVLDNGGSTLVTTQSGIVVIAPACL